MRSDQIIKLKLVMELMLDNKDCKNDGVQQRTICLNSTLFTHQLTLPSKLHLYKPAAPQPLTFTFTIHSLK